MLEVHATSSSTTAEDAPLTVRDVEHRLTNAESALLLGAFFALAASLASFMTL